MKQQREVAQPGRSTQTGTDQQIRIRDTGVLERERAHQDLNRRKERLKELESPKATWCVISRGCIAKLQHFFFSTP